MSRYQRLLSQRQRDKQIDERNQANFRESYLDHFVETAHIGIRHFANPIILGRKRRKSKHDNLNSIISYLHKKNGLNIIGNNDDEDDEDEEDIDIEMKNDSNIDNNNNDSNKRRDRENDNVSSFERRRKRRKLRHSIDQIRNDENVQKSFYKSSIYCNIDDITDNNNEEMIDSEDHSYCVWKFHHQKRDKAEEIMYESGYRCVLCLKSMDDIYSLQKHVLCWHSKLTFDIKMMNEYLSIINVKCKPSKICYQSFMDNIYDLNEYYYGWINIWNHYYLKCDRKIREEINEKYFVNDTFYMNDDNKTEDIDINKLYRLKWDFHNKLCLELLSKQSSHRHGRNKSLSKTDIVSTFSLSRNQFKNRTISSLRNKEKLLMVEEVLKYPLMTGRMSKVCKYIGLKNVKFLKKLMAIYPMLLLLNGKEISLHLIAKWNQWKCNIKKDILVENVTNNDLKSISLKDILLKIRENDKGITSLSPKNKLWLCSYILSHGGKSFISQFKDHLESEECLDDIDASTYITNSSLYNIYYNFCGYMMLCGQFPLSTQGMNALNKWWNEVKRVFSFGYNNMMYRQYGSANIKMAENRNRNKRKPSKRSKAKKTNKNLSRKRNIRLDEKVVAIRDIIYNKKSIEEYCTTFDVKTKTIIRWINNSKKLLQKCEAECGLDDIWGIYNTENITNQQQSIQEQQEAVTIIAPTSLPPKIRPPTFNINDGNDNNDNNTTQRGIENDIEITQEQENDEKKEEGKVEETQFKVFLEKVEIYLNMRRPKRKSKNKDKEEMDHSLDDIDGDISGNTEDSEYDPMNESASNRRVASSQHSSNFEREYQTRNVNVRRGRIESHELKYNKGYYHGTTFSRINDENLIKYKNGSDTEMEYDDEWLLKWEKNLLFDFEDISYGEKLMMGFWNEFIRKQNKNRIYASYMVPVKLIIFAQSHKEIIMQNNLKLPFLFHCITLWEFGFIEAKCIQETMHIINQYEREQKKKQQQQQQENENSVDNV